MRSLLALFLTALAATGGDQPPRNEPSPPRITDAQRAKSWRAQAEILAAQKKFAEAQTALQQVNAEMQFTCAADTRYLLGTDAAGEPACVLKTHENH